MDVALDTIIVRIVIYSRESEKRSTVDATVSNSSKRRPRRKCPEGAIPKGRAVKFLMLSSRSPHGFSWRISHFRTPIVVQQFAFRNLAMMYFDLNPTYVNNVLYKSDSSNYGFLDKFFHGTTMSVGI